MGLKGGIAQSAERGADPLQRRHRLEPDGRARLRPEHPAGPDPDRRHHAGLRPWLRARIRSTWSPLVPAANNIFTTAEPRAAVERRRWPPLRCIKTRPTGSMNQLERGLRRTLLRQPERRTRARAARTAGRTTSRAATTGTRTRPTVHRSRSARLQGQGRTTPVELQSGRPAARDDLPDDDRGVRGQRPEHVPDHRLHRGLHHRLRTDRGSGASTSTTRAPVTTPADRPGSLGRKHRRLRASGATSSSTSHPGAGGTPSGVLQPGADLQPCVPVLVE